MTESIWVVVIQVIIGPATLTALGIVGYALRKRIDHVSREVSKTKQEITNSHPMHLRDDLDGKFRLVFARQDSILTELQNVDRKLDANKADLDMVFSMLADHESRLSGQASKLRRVSNSRR